MTVPIQQSTSTEGQHPLDRFLTAPTTPHPLDRFLSDQPLQHPLDRFLPDTMRQAAGADVTALQAEQALGPEVPGTQLGKFAADFVLGAVQLAKDVAVGTINMTLGAVSAEVPLAETARRQRLPRRAGVPG